MAADALNHLVDMADGDARAALTTLEVALALAAVEARDEIGLDEVECARQSRVLRYGEDDHYDVISAFIKSIRGSDPDAGLYWLARMLEAGEDARYIARRLVILASEDVGMADSMALVVADAAARAVKFVGLPEAGLNLAHAVIYLATAPKSNTTMAGLSRAFDDVRQRQAGAVPLPLRSVHSYQRNKLREGGGYRYPHTTRRASSPRSTAHPTSPARSARRGGGCTTGPRPTATRQRSETAEGMVGRRPVRPRGLVGVREVPRPRSLTGWVTTALSRCRRRVRRWDRRAVRGHDQHVLIPGSPKLVVSPQPPWGFVYDNRGIKLLHSTVPVSRSRCSAASPSCLCRSSVSL
jgi:hypothetical protein